MSEFINKSVIELLKFIFTPTFLFIYLIAVILGLLTIFINKKEKRESFSNFIKRMISKV